VAQQQHSHHRSLHCPQQQQGWAHASQGPWLQPAPPLMMTSPPWRQAEQALMAVHHHWSLALSLVRTLLLRRLQRTLSLAPWLQESLLLLQLQRWRLHVSGRLGQVVDPCCLYSACCHSQSRLILCCHPLLLPIC